MAGTGAEAKAYEVKTPLQIIMCVYKELKGVRFDDREWDKAQGVHDPKTAGYARFGRAARNLIGAAGGDYRLARVWLIQFSDKMIQAGRDWTLDTAASRAWDDAELAGTRNAKTTA